MVEDQPLPSTTLHLHGASPALHVAVFVKHSILKQLGFNTTLMKDPIVNLLMVASVQGIVLIDC